VPGAPSAYGPLDRQPDYEQLPGVLVLRLEAPLFYANAEPTGDHIKQLIGASEPTPTQ
jgi:MFS superfamily sulfate permease-like transporter